MTLHTTRVLLLIEYGVKVCPTVVCNTSWFLSRRLGCVMRCANRCAVSWHGWCGARRTSLQHSPYLSHSLLQKSSLAGTNMFAVWLFTLYYACTTTQKHIYYKKSVDREKSFLFWKVPHKLLYAQLEGDSYKDSWSFHYWHGKTRRIEATKFSLSN
jgi:hypothetical protein